MGKLRPILTALLKKAVDTEELDEVAKFLCQQLVQSDAAERVMVVLYDVERGQQILRFAEGRIPSASADVYEIAEIEKLRNSNDGYILYDNEGAIRTRLAVSLCVHSKFSGVLSLSSSSARRYSASDIKTLKEIASVFSLTIENRLLLIDIPVSLYRTHLPGMLALNRLRNKVMDEINRVDRYGGEFSLLILSPSLPKTNGDSLRSLKAFISENIRQVDSIAIWRENIGIVMPNTSAAEALVAAKRLRKLIKTDWGIEEGLLLEPCFGIASYPHDSPFASGLIEAAEIALNRAVHQRSRHIKNYSSFSQR